MPIYRQLIIFSDIIAHPYPRTENVQSFGTILALMAYLLDAYPLTDLRKGSFRTSLSDVLMTFYNLSFSQQCLNEVLKTTCGHIHIPTGGRAP